MEKETGVRPISDYAKKQARKLAKEGKKTEGEGSDTGSTSNATTAGGPPAKRQRISSGKSSELKNEQILAGAQKDYDEKKLACKLHLQNPMRPSSYH